MKACRNLLLALLFVLCAPSLSARDKIVEKSGKKTPDWIMSAGKDAFSVFAQDDDINAARDKCLADIKQYIINSIASNVTSVERSTSESHTDNGMEDIYTTYNSDLKVAAAKLPFLPDISLSNAQEVYWEKYRREENKDSYYYRYYVLYPYSEMERNRLIRKFLAYDRQKYDALTALKDIYSTLTDVSQIDAGIRELEPLTEYFFDDVRRKEAISLMEAYRKAYQKISLIPESHELGRFSYRLMLDGRTVTSSKMPSLRSETAVALRLKPEGEGYVLTYDYSLCYPEDDNFISISYSFPGASLIYKYEFDVREKDMRVRPEGVVSIDVAPSGDSTAVAQVSMNLRSASDMEFKVSDVCFSLSPSAVFNSGEVMDFEGRGMHFMKFVQYVTFAKQLASVPARGMMTGTMYIMSKGRKEKIVFTLPFKLTVRENECMIPEEESEELSN